MVQKMILFDRSYDAQNHSHHPGKNSRHHRQLHGIRKGFHNHGGYASIVFVALSHIAAKKSRQISEELFHHRLIQIHGLGQAVNGFLIDMLPEKRRHRIARHHPQHDKNQKDDTDQNRNGPEDSFYDLFHVYLLPQPVCGISVRPFLSGPSPIRRGFRACPSGQYPESICFS